MTYLGTWSFLLPIFAKSADPRWEEMTEIWALGDDQARDE